MPQIFTPEQELDICTSYRKGESFPSLERRYEAFYTDINDVLTKHVVPHRVMGELAKLLKDREIGVVKEYLDGDSIRKLALSYGVDRDVIKRVLVERQIPLRQSRETNRKKIYDEEKLIALHAKGKSFSAIGREVGLGATAVSVYLQKRGLHKAAKTRKGRACEISPEIMEEIAKTYVEDGWSLGRILRHYNLKTGHSNLSRYLRRRGITIRAGAVQNRQYHCDSEYFTDPHSPTKYWLLGLIATDGYVHEEKGYVSIELDTEDIAALEYVKTALSFTGPIHDNPAKHSSILTIHDDRLVADLVKLGMHQRKSLTLQPMPWIRDDLFPHFLNGFITGDGWITRVKPNRSRKTEALTVGFCGSSDLVPWVARKVENRWDISLSRSRRRGCHQYVTSARSAVLGICGEMFRNAPFVLKRKHEAYLRYLAYLTTSLSA